VTQTEWPRVKQYRRQNVLHGVILSGWRSFRGNFIQGWSVLDLYIFCRLAATWHTRRQIGAKFVQKLQISYGDKSCDVAVVECGVYCLTKTDRLMGVPQRRGVQVGGAGHCGETYRSHQQYLSEIHLTQSEKNL